MRAYKAVDSWVRMWSRPGGQEYVVAAPDAAAPLAAPGACITLRWQGQVVGRGVAQAFRPAGGGANEGAPSTTIARAASAAIAAAETRLPLPNDLSRGEAVRQIAPELMISLELAGDLRPMIADTWTDLDTALNPGLDGLAVTIDRPGNKAAPDAGADVDAPAIGVKFPSEMMLANLLPQRAVRAMVAAGLSEVGAPAGEALSEPKDLREKHGVRVWTFRVGHVAQAKVREQAKFLYRGATAVSTSEVTLNELRAMADRLEAHIRDRLRRSDNTLATFGDYDPAGSRYSDNGRLSEQFYLASAAVNFRGTAVGSPLPEALTSLFERVQPACETAQDVLFRSMGRGCFPSGKAGTIPGASLTGLIHGSLRGAATDSPDPDFKTPSSLELVERLRWANLTAPERALLVFATAAPPHERPEDTRMACTLVRRVFADTQGDSLPALMPWLGWAELDCAEPGKDADAPLPEIPSAIALREMRAQCWKHQLGFTDVNEDSADMLGGIMFTKSGGTPLPTWQCVRPIAFLATMLGDERLTEPSERKQEALRLLLALRFLRQLQVDESCGWMYPEPEKAIGGIRAAAWDHSMPPDATSLTLMAVCEAIRSLEKLEAIEKAEKK